MHFTELIFMVNTQKREMSRKRGETTGKRNRWKQHGNNMETRGIEGKQQRNERSQSHISQLHSRAANNGSWLVITGQFLPSIVYSEGAFLVLSSENWILVCKNKILQSKHKLPLFMNYLINLIKKEHSLGYRLWYRLVFFYLSFITYCSQKSFIIDVNQISKHHERRVPCLRYSHSENVYSWHIYISIWFSDAQYEETFSRPFSPLSKIQWFGSQTYWLLS